MNKKDLWKRILTTVIIFVIWIWSVASIQSMPGVELLELLLLAIVLIIGSIVLQLTWMKIIIKRFFNFKR